MILERLTLCNFCLYRGEQTFNLAPARRNGKGAPIILIGGINGGGKTTVLDAIQLALYGSRALCSKRGALSYEQFLRECIHHGVAADEGASLALSFRFAAEGEENLYEVCRAWSLRGQKVSEELYVSRDGVRDRWLSDNWNQMVEELVPLGISQLFFFDAEKIRFLAEDESCSAVLGSAIKSLLGLDLAERLIADAAAMESRFVRQIRSDEEAGEIAKLESEIQNHDAQLTAIREQAASLETERDGALAMVRQAERRFAARGGEYWKERETRQQRIGEVRNQESTIAGQLTTLAAGGLPMALLPDLLAGVADQDQSERTAGQARSLLGLLKQRDAELLRAIKEAAVSAKAAAAVREYQDADRSRREASASHVESRLALSDRAREGLLHLRQRELPESIAEVGRLMAQLSDVKQERESLERAIAAVPDDASIKEVAEQLRKAAEEQATVTAKIRNLAEQEKSVTAAREVLELQRQKLLGKQTEEEIGTQEAARMAQLAARTRETMKEFLRQATTAKIHRLSTLITESFRFLLRKKTLVQQIHIDPETFAVRIFDDSGHALPKRRLSEGEKQIFAISVLWGLARASARSLPAIIDTPMARLDVKHRNHLVQRYFPNASHQVVILSTDTEVDCRYYNELAPYISRAYHLKYDEEKKMTVGEEGYFWTQGRVEDNREEQP
ncbi:MAG: DNA sulfur modification protein DndD [Planctomycetota bacterium]